jgi:Ca-activated chloride channel homolog
MNFLAPGRLWLLVVVVALAAAYVVVQRRRRHYAARFTNLDLLASVAPKRPGWRRHVAAAAMLAALVVLVAAWARPTRPERVPRERATVMLAVDTSVSMRATDVEPSRLEAAKAAGSAFVDNLPSRTRRVRRRRPPGGRTHARPRESPGLARTAPPERAHGDR